MPDFPADRRRFLARALALIAAVPLFGASARVLGAPPPLKKLPPGHPTATALHYTEDANKTKHPSHKVGSFCLNCQFYTAGTHGCALFAGFAVAPKGWCTAWAKKG